MDAQSHIAPVCRGTILAALLTLGCSNGPSGKVDGRVPEITVAAAADLQSAFGDLARLFEDKTGSRVLLSFGSTGQLAQQIEQGAPFDIFAAANVEYLERLEAKRLIIAESQQLYARGRIVLAVREQSELQVTKLEDLLQSGVKYVAIANPGHAPYGLAAKQALEHEGLWDELKDKLVMGENVRQALQYVLTSNAEAGIVALSVAQTPGLKFTLIDDSWHAPLDQALAIVASTKQERLASQFIAFLNGPEGRPIMKKYGFILPDELE